MVSAIPTFVLIAATAVAVGCFVGLVAPPVSRWRNRGRAKTLNAIWCGTAAFDVPLRADQPASIHAAFSGVGKPYARVSRQLHSGVLVVFSDRLAWRPRLWLGNGQASPWSIPIAEVDGLEAKRSSFPVVGSYEATIRTRGGPIRCVLLDPKGAAHAIDIARVSPHSVRAEDDATDADWQRWYADNDS